MIINIKSILNLIINIFMINLNIFFNLNYFFLKDILNLFKIIL